MSGRLLAYTTLDKPKNWFQIPHMNGGLSWISGLVAGAWR